MADHSTIDNHGAFLDRAADLPGLLARNAASLTRKFGKSAHRGFKMLQYGRMLSVLSASSDQQLEAMGITRADIPQHAALLIEYEYDGL